MQDLVNLKQDEYSFRKLENLSTEKLGKIIDLSGAVLPKGHYGLVNRDCSDSFFDFNAITNDPHLLNGITNELIGWIRSNIEHIDVVLSPVTAGRILAYDIVREFNGDMKSRTAYAGVDEFGAVLNNLTMASRIETGEKVLLCTDIATTGKGLRSLEKIATDYKGNIVGLVGFAVRSEQAREVENKIVEENNILSKFLIDFFWNHFPRPCEMCAADVPRVEPAGGLKVQTIFRKDIVEALELV